MSNLKPDIIEKVYFTMNEVEAELNRSDSTILYWCSVYGVLHKQNGKVHKFHASAMGKLRMIKLLSRTKSVAEVKEMLRHK